MRFKKKKEKDKLRDLLVHFRFRNEGNSGISIYIPSLSLVHDVFHIPMLQKYEPNPSHILDYHPTELKEDLMNIESPVQIFDQKKQGPRKRLFHLISLAISLIRRGCMRA